MKAFLDTNVLMAAFLTDGVSHRLLEQLVAGDFEAMVSVQVLEELEEHLRDDFRVPSDDLRRALGLISRLCRVVPTPSRPPKVSRDPDDNAILAAALEYGADVLVTGDKDLLVLADQFELKILRPAEFVRLSR